ncbi:hypothetical protein Q8G48_28390, partial [Klebsiella pneumoniae]|uniref:hypothetical protein n=1 Tax=Klebsiella pneumoniae TaxID=573 RepID=UPI0030138935
ATGTDANVDAAAGASTETKPTLRFPSAPMMGVVLSEMLMSSSGDLNGAMVRYFSYLSDCFGGAVVSLYALDGKLGRLIAGAGQVIEIG